MSGIGIRRYKPSGLGDYLRENFSRDRGIEETYWRPSFLVYVENLEIDNSLKWVLFNVVSGQITGNALWK